MSNKLSDPTLIKSQQESFGASAAIQNYVATILKQADISLDAMPNLPQHQKTARTHAYRWNEAIRPGMITTNTDIIDYANTFASFYEALRGLADKVATDPKVREQFIAGLTTLKTNIMRKKSAANQTILDLKAFQANLGKDYIVFTTDAKKASDIYVGDNGEIAKIESEIDATQKTINAQIATMSGGAIGILVGIVAICVGAFAEIETAGLSTGLIVSGIGLVTGGITSEVVGGVQFAQAIDKMAKLKIELQEDKQGLMVVKVIKGQLDGIVDQLRDAVTATGILLDSWNALDESIDKLKSDIQTDPGKYGPQLKSMLDTAKEDWSEALSLARKMQPTGKIKVQHYTKIQDAIHTTNG